MSSWREGDRVQVTGPFKGFQGTVVQEEGDHPIISLRIFGRVTPVALDADKLGPDDGGGGAGVREPRPSTTPPLIFPNRERRGRSSRAGGARSADRRDHLVVLVDPTEGEFKAGNVDGDDAGCRKRGTLIGPWTSIT
jgi:hypothetical protein